MLKDLWNEGRKGGVTARGAAQAREERRRHSGHHCLDPCAHLKKSVLAESWTWEAGHQPLSLLSPPLGSRQCGDGAGGGVQMAEQATLGSWHQAQAERPFPPPDLSAPISSSPAWEPLAGPGRRELASPSLTSHPHPHPPPSEGYGDGWPTRGKAVRIKALSKP